MKTDTMNCFVLARRGSFFTAQSISALAVWLTCFFAGSVSASPVTFAVGLGIAAVGQQRIDPSKVIGHQACADCHKSELAAWQQSTHAKTSFSMLKTNPKAKEFGKALKISDVTSATAVCTDCHGLRHRQGDQVAVLEGNSCESCHGGSGPRDKGWFALHSDFGGQDVKREQETQAHYQQRITDCKELGMNRSEDIYELAKNCLQCHTVPSEEVVNDGGHPSGKAEFEFLSWSQGEVRHNFQLDQTKNAEAPTLWTHARFRDVRTAQGRKRLMYVVGQLADLEVSLRNRAQATGRGNFLTTTGRRINAATDNLEDINKIVNLPEIAAALAAAKPIKRSQFRRVSKGDAKFFGAIADAVGAQAKGFAENRDGSMLAGIDKLLPSKPMGNAFKPKK